MAVLGFVSTVCFRDGNGNINTLNMGMGMGSVGVTMGMGMASFNFCQKFPLIRRLITILHNEICRLHEKCRTNLSPESVNSLLNVNSNVCVCVLRTCDIVTLLLCCYQLRFRFALSFEYSLTFVVHNRPMGMGMGGNVKKFRELNGNGN